MGLKAINSERFSEIFELFESVNSEDALGYQSTDVQSRGDFYGSVVIMSGYKLLQYQNLGYKSPAKVKMFDPLFSVAELLWNGRRAIVKSQITDTSDRDKVVLTIDFLE